MTVRDSVPDGVQYVRSDPPATVDGNQLIWTLAPLAGGRSHSLQAVVRTTKPGPVTNTAVVQTRDGLRAEHQATTEVTVPQIGVQIKAPESAVLGSPLTYEIAVTNPGNGPATNVVLVDDFDGGLEHDTRANPLRMPVGVLAPGETKTIPLTLTARQAGRFMNRVVATADGNLTAKAEHAVAVQKAQVQVQLQGPKTRFLNREADWTITVNNAGEMPLANVVVRDQLPPELAFVSAGQGGQLVRNEVVWNLGTLQPGEQKAVQVKTNAVKMTPKALHVAVATADPGLKAQAESAIEINGLPAFRMEVSDRDDPVEVGGRTGYRIEVTNQGSLPGNQVTVAAVVPPQLRVVTANGPAQPRIEAGRVTFPPVDSLPPGQKMVYTVEVQALQAGDVRFRVELTSSTLTEPVIEEESTNVYAPPPGGTAAAPGSLPANFVGPPAPPRLVPTPVTPVGFQPGTR
jgi:uncharacterized repeat protein (TIGR01451 family)